MNTKIAALGDASPAIRLHSCQDIPVIFSLPFRTATSRAAGIADFRHSQSFAWPPPATQHGIGWMDRKTVPREVRKDVFS